MKWLFAVIPAFAGMTMAGTFFEFVHAYRENEVSITG
jgi:hypothetical protein